MNSSKRQKVPAQGLYVCATPIGNLKDLSSRVREVFQNCDRILCEDTRRTGQLLQAIGVKTSTERFDSYTQEKKIKQLVSELLSGKSFALVTDAGTPGVSDPASELVREAHLNQISVIPVPGPSAVTTLISVSGFSCQSFSFLGFFPRKQADQEKVIEEIKSLGRSQVCVWFESPARVVKTMDFLAERVPDIQTVVGKEMTKLYEKIFWGKCTDVQSQVLAEIETEGEKGEFCLGVWIEPEKLSSDLNPSETWEKALLCLLESGVSVSDSAKKVSQVFGVSKNDVYRRGNELRKR